MKENKLSTSLTWLLILMVFLLPIFFLPQLINPFYNSKLIMAFLVAFISGFAFILQGLRNKNWRFIQTPLTLPLLGFAVLVVVSSLISHQYPGGQFLGMGGVYLCFAAIVLIAPTLLSKNKLNEKFAIAINSAAVLLSILSILQLFGYGLAPLISKISIWSLTDNLSFSLAGMAFVTIQLLSVVLLSNVLDQKIWKKSLFSKIATIVIAIALGINIWAVLPGGQAQFQNLSLTASTAIAKDSLVFTKNAIFGYGPDSYNNAFNILKPLWINGLNYWQITFDSAFNLPLTLIVSVGVVGVLSYLLFLWKTLIVLNKENNQGTFLKVFISGALIWQFFSPLNLVMFILLAIALSFFIALHLNQYKQVSFNADRVIDLENDHELHKDRATLVKIKNYVLVSGSALMFVLLSFAFYIVAKSFVAYNSLYQSQVSVANKNITKAYTDYNKAKVLVPQLDFIRRNNALINLELAIAFSNKTDISAAEQEQVLQLVNQAINEAKAATVLGPSNYQNWYVLAQIYMQLLNITDQAKQEAFNALAKAITYNPSNPELRLVMGQLFLNSEDYNNAVTFFSQAVERKKNLPSAHYYLAQALIAAEQWTEAQKFLSNTLLLLEEGSQDYETVKKDLEIVEARIEGSKKLENQAVDQEVINASDSATLTANPISTDSGLSTLLDQQETEAVIQDGALTSDQNLVEN